MMTPRLIRFPLMPRIGLHRSETAGQSVPLAFSDDYTSSRAVGSSVIKHEGTDLFTPEGVLIVSTTSGKVIASRWSGLGGWAVMIQASASHTYTLLYAHMRIPPFVIAGARVEPGTLLGVVGSTGGVKDAAIGARFPRGPHLHFSVKNGAAAVNMYPQLNSMAPGNNPRSWPGPEGALLATAIADASHAAWNRIASRVLDGTLNSDAAVTLVAAAAAAERNRLSTTTEAR